MKIVGKELVAQMLSKNESSSRVLIPVNCGAISENLIESELFGHCRGAFTGAVKDRIGKFELAHHGDLFLDEIGDLPLAAQVKLLRVLQEGEITRVGETSSRRVSVRIIAATNRNLLAMVENGTFRTDLYYRLNVIPIQTTPLRERPSDIPDIARFLLTILAKGKIRLDDRALDLLVRQSWPGNIRELRNTIERAIIEAQIRHSDTIETRDLDFLSEERQKSHPGQISLPSLLTEISMESWDGYVRQAEREYLLKAMALFEDNVEALARHMSYGRSTLFKRLSALGLSRRKPGLTTFVEKEAVDDQATHY
ncbi:sigma 54-interacting transcriptional regulator [Bdellovibrionota bacterium FG-1]